MLHLQKATLISSSLLTSSTSKLTPILFNSLFNNQHRHLATTQNNRNNPNRKPQTNYDTQKPQQKHSPKPSMSSLQAELFGEDFDDVRKPKGNYETSKSQQRHKPYPTKTSPQTERFDENPDDVRPRATYKQSPYPKKTPGQHRNSYEYPSDSRPKTAHKQSPPSKSQQKEQSAPVYATSKQALPLRKPISDEPSVPVEKVQREKKVQKSESATLWNKIDDYQGFRSDVEVTAKDLKKVLAALEDLMSLKFRHNEFERRFFKSYEYFMSEVLENIRNEPRQESDLITLVEIFHLQSTIYFMFGRLDSTDLSRLQGRLIKEISANLSDLPADDVYLFIEGLSNFDVKNSGALRRNDEAITNLVKELDVKYLSNLLRYLTKMKYHNDGVIEILTEKIYRNLDEYDLKTKITILNSLNVKHFKPNKTFLVQTCESISQEIEKYPFGELPYGYAANFLFSLSELEKRYTGGLFYMGEIDRVYEQIMQSIKKNISKYNILEIYRICSGLQRCSIYDEEMLKLILNEVLRREFFGFGSGKLTEEHQGVEEKIKEVKEKMDSMTKEEKDTREYRDLLVEYKKLSAKKVGYSKEIRENMNNLNSFSGIIHSFAVFRYQDSNFVKFVNEIIELYYLKFLHEEKKYVEFLEMSNIPKMIWSLCVLGSPSDIKKSVRYLLNILLKSEYQNNLNLIDITQMYYSVIYLQDTGVFDAETVEFMKTHFINLNKGAIKTISMIHLDICKYLTQLEIGHSIEERIEMIPVDIILEQKNKNGKNIVIDFHGYNHFFRNTEDLKGNAVLKRKLLENLGHDYIEITIFDWLLLDDKQKLDYIRKLLLDE